MTFFGKFLILLNTFVAFALLTWGFSIYSNRVDWTEVRDGDKKLTERTKELNDAMAPAQRDYSRLLIATANKETDVEKLREKYRLERERRLKAAGTDQYTLAEGSFARFADDPYAPPAPPREPIG